MFFSSTSFFIDLGVEQHPTREGGAGFQKLADLLTSVISTDA